MNVTEAIEALAEQDYLVFEDEYEVESYMSLAGWHHEYDCDWETPAMENGWIDGNDPQYALEELARDEHVGLVDMRDIEYAHDTEEHTGAIAYCDQGACAAVNNY